MTPFLTDPSDFCPGCGARSCECPPADHEDALDAAAYQAGYDDCAELGYDQRPTPTASAWLDPHADAYFRGYDDAGCGLASEVEAPAAHAVGVLALVGGWPMPELSEHLYGPWPLGDDLPF